MRYGCSVLYGDLQSAKVGIQNGVSVQGTSICDDPCIQPLDIESEGRDEKGVCDRMNAETLLWLSLAMGWIHWMVSNTNRRL